MRGSPSDQSAGRQANAADTDSETFAKSIGEVASPLLAGFSFTNVIVIIVSGTGHFLLPGEAIISWTIASIAFVFAVQFAKWVARKKVNYERTVFFYHVGVVTFLLGFGFALAPPPSTGAYLSRWIASGGAFAVCVIEAGVYVNRELRERGLRRFEEALVICRETGDRDGEAQTLNNLGEAYRELRRFEEAIGGYQESLVIRRETGDRHGEAQTLNNLGEAYPELRRFDEAIECLKESLVIRRETRDRYGEGRTLSNLGDVYQRLRQPDRAAACWRDAAAAVRDAGDHEEAARLERQAASAGSLRHRWRRGS